jgi:hypothetical protein
MAFAFRSIMEIVGPGPESTRFLHPTAVGSLGEEPDDRTVGRSEARTTAIKTLTDFLDQDPTGTRKMVYRMQVLQELTRTANANGHNTILTDLTGPSPTILPLPTGR